MFYNPFTPKGFARGLANAQLKSLHIVQRKFPHLSNLELYAAALSGRPGYTEQQIITIITQAVDIYRNGLKMRGYTEEKIESVFASDFNFQKAVIALAGYEYRKRIGQPPSPQVSNEIADGVTSVIPYSV